MTGKIISRFRKVNTYCQYPVWADERWEYRGSVFDEFVSGRRDARWSPRPRRAVISVGTQEGYPFTRMLDAVVPLLENFDEVLYQTGDLEPRGVGHRRTQQRALRGAAARDRTLRRGDQPRRSRRGADRAARGQASDPDPAAATHNEHVDDHQLQMARELERRGLATTRTPESLTYQDILDASRRSVRTTTPPAFHLRSRVDADDVRV